MNKSKSKKKKRNKNRNYQNKNLRNNSNSYKKKLWYNKLKDFCIKCNIVPFFTVLGTIFTLITIIQWFYPNTNDSVATQNYEKGLIFLEDGNLQEAEKYFRKAYKNNNNLLDIKYYYSYTEYLLRNYELSYKILQANKNSLNTDELALYAIYEINNGNVKIGRKYLNKISEPEKLKHFSFILYIIASTQSEFLTRYGDGVTTFLLNITLIDKKIAECHIFPHIKNEINTVVDVDIDFDTINETIFRIEQDQNSNLIELNRCKLLMYFLFNLYSVQYDMLQMPEYYFTEGLEYFDYENYKNLSMEYLKFMLLFTMEISSIDTDFIDNLIGGYEEITKKYEHLISLEQQKNTIIIDENDRKWLDRCRQILNDFNNDCFDASNYVIVIKNEDGEITDNVLKIWSEYKLRHIREYVENFR